MSICIEPQGARDVFSVDHPEQASCAALLSAALAPWEGLNPVAFASEALRQIAADLCLLESSLSDTANGPLSSEIMRRFVAGIEHRARVAAEVATRLEDARKAERKEAANG